MDNINEYTIDYESLEITDGEIGTMIGYTKSEIPELVKQQIHDIRMDIENYCKIKGGFRRINKIQLKNNLLILDDKRFLTGKIIASPLKQANSVAVFVCTAGKGLSNWVSQLFIEEEPLKAYIADIIASLIVEKATDHLQKKLEEQVFPEQQKITNRYSPGYCGWNVSEQHQLFSLLPANFCGVSLNESALMNPMKSVSGIIGIGRDVKKTAYQCNKCEKKDCLLAIKESSNNKNSS